MKKIILSVAMATMALSTAAAALEDIKTTGQAKLWFETNNANNKDLFDKTSGSGEVAFKLGMTGKQGNVGFGATMYDVSSMGLAATAVNGVRTDGSDYNNPYLGEMYITAPVGAKTLLKFGKQELDTPFAFTERWNVVPNTFNAAVAVNNSISNVTLIGAYVGQSSMAVSTTGTGISANSGTPTNLYLGDSTFAAAALYKNDGLAVNFWAYSVSSTMSALWLDAAMNLGGVNVKAYANKIDPTANNQDSTTAFALSAGAKVSGISVFGALSRVSEGQFSVGNTATNSKKTKLPTMGVYTDGVYVARPGSKAYKLKASGKIGNTNIALQAVKNTNSAVALTDTLDTLEFDLILSQKVGDFNFKAIVMDRSFDNATLSTSTGGQYIRIVTSVNF